MSKLCKKGVKLSIINYKIYYYQYYFSVTKENFSIFNSIENATV